MRTHTQMVANFKKAIDAWECDDAEPDMKKMYTKDRKDLRKVLTQFKNKKYVKAFNMACDLDTLVRDQIPDDVYELMLDADQEEWEKNNGKTQ